MQVARQSVTGREWLMGVLCLLTVAAPCGLAAQQAGAESHAVHRLFQADQRDRTAGRRSATAMMARDAVRRDTVRKMLDAGQLATGQDFFDAAVIFQHGTTARDFVLAHVLATTALAMGDTDAQWLAAASLDRYLQAIAQPQAFGTQYVPEDRRAVPPVYGQGAYDTTLVPDALRRLFCVSTHADQRRNVESLNRGHGLVVPDGCPSRDEGAPPPSDAPSIHAMFTQDQHDRMTPNANWDSVSAHDSTHRVSAHRLLANGALVTGRDFEEAAFIFQHGAEPADYLLAHVLALASLVRGDTAGRWIAASTLDRYLQSVKEPQVFGTQYRWPHEGPQANVATQSPYDDALLPDALRRDFCVTSRAGQRENVTALNQHKDFPSSDACPAPSDGK